MRVDINPFYHRASDNIESEERFVKLFSPEILTVFSDHPIWNAVNIVRSSQGGGKTTLFKIFSPKVLSHIKNTKGHDEHSKELYNLLSESGIFTTNGGIAIASSIISFNTQFRNLEYLNMEEGQKTRLFCSLLNTRIVLSVLKSICYTKEINYPGELVKITFTEEQNLDLPVHLRSVTNGFQLYEWATAEEEKIADLIDNIHTTGAEQVKGGDSFYSLDILAPANILLDNKNLDLKVLIMLDDVHNLSAIQRSFLVKTIIDKRPKINTWISERLKALTMEEMLSEGSTEGRDINIIELEYYWSSKPSQFERFAKSVANRRVELAFDNNRDFASFLSLDMSPKYESIISDALQKVQARVKKKYGSNNKYDSWISAKEEFTGSPYQTLIEWRSLEILLFRDSNKKQMTLDFIELDTDSLEAKDGSDVKTAAQLFVHDEFKIPFYYGISTICRLGSSNIEQFLHIAGELFDIVQTNTIKKIINSNLSLQIFPDRQEDTIYRIVNQKWKELSTSVPMFDDVKKFLDAVGQYCYSETFTPNAWNSPGINGIAITMAERNEIKNVVLKDRNNQYYKLAKCLTICIAYNLIDYKLDYKCKGNTWMILYLNRIYCAKYNLPLNNGKFKERKLKDLLGWMNNGINIQPKLKL